MKKKEAREGKANNNEGEVMMDVRGRSAAGKETGLSVFGARADLGADDTESGQVKSTSKWSAHVVLRNKVNK